MYVSSAATSSSVESGAASGPTRRRYGWLIDANCSASVSIETSPMLATVGSPARRRLRMRRTQYIHTN